MRILSHRAAVLLLLTLPHLLADEPSSSAVSDNAAKNDDFVDPTELEEEHTSVDTTTTTTTTNDASSGQDQKPQALHRMTEPIISPQQHDEETTNLSRDSEEELADDEIETKIIPPGEEHSSSSATSDNDNNRVVDDGEESEIQHESLETEENGSDEADAEENASQVVHEDEFRLSPLPATETATETSEESKSSNDDDDVAPSLASLRIEETKGDPPSKSERGSPHDDASITVNQNDEDREEEGSIDLIAERPNTVIDTGDDEVVVVETAKFAIGTTSTDSLEENIADDDDDDTSIDESMIVDDSVEEKQDEDVTVSSSTDETMGESAENAATETTEKEADENPQTGAGDSSESEGDTEKIIESGQTQAIDSNASEDQNIKEDAGVVVPSEGETEKSENEQEEEVKVDADDEDEDLSDRVLVDYASKSAGALIIETTKEFKGTSNLITGNRDKYAIVPCSEEKKYFVLSLSEEILVKEIKLTNYERFSSTVKDFQVKGSPNLQKWVDLGTYKTEPGHGEQTFVMEDPTWARYLKFKFLTYHGFEHYCTLSQIKVHGSNAAEGFHEQWESIQESNDEQAEDDVSDDATENPTGVAEEETEVNVTNPVNEEETKREGDSFISSKSAIEDTKVSTNSDDLDVGEKVHNSSGNLKEEPLANFRTPTTFSEILQGEMEDEELFADIFDLIPKTISTLPAHTKNDIESKPEDGELRTVHQISQRAIESLYSVGSQIVDDIAEMISEVNESDAIVSPKMNDLDDDYLEKKFGSGLSSMMKLNHLPLNADHPLPPVESSQIDAIKTSNEGNDEATQRPNEARQEPAIEVAETPPKKEEPPAPKEKEVVEETNDPVNVAMAKLLKDLPSAECLANLDFAEFKSKIPATRKLTGAAGGSQGGNRMEPIFKKLTDEIFALQTSLSVHDQFTKLSVGCYQRVILDLTMEMGKLRRDHEERLVRLEEQMSEPANMRMFNKLLLSVLSTLATWSVAIATHLFRTVRDAWIPAIFRSLLSESNYNKSAKISHSVIENSSTVIGYISATWQSNEVSSKFVQYATTMCQALLSTISDRSRFEAVLSAWSSFYDGGVTVLAAVLLFLLCRATLRAVSSFRTKEERVRPNRRMKKSDPPSSQNSLLGFHDNSLTTTMATTTTIAQEPPATSHSDELTLHATTTTTTSSSMGSVSSKKKNRKSRKHQTQNNKDGDNDDDDDSNFIDSISLKSSEEGVPELDDESQDATGYMEPPGRPSSPSMVSLEE